jgi:hypothetical protein
VPFETALNFLWLSLGVLALASTIRSTYRQRSKKGRTPAWLHIVGVALIVAALFPYISATDDVLCIEHFSSQQKPGNAGQKSQNDDLIRLYQTIDTPLVAAVKQISLTLFFVVLVVALVARRIDRHPPFESGRSPPSALTA